MQEAYRPPCSKSFGRGGSYLGQGVPTTDRGIPILAGVTYLGWGYLLWPRGYLPWPRGYPPWPGYTPGVNRQTPVKTVPSPNVCLFNMNYMFTSIF